MSERHEIRGDELREGDVIHFLGEPRRVIRFEEYTGPLRFDEGARTVIADGGWRLTLGNYCRIDVYAR